MKNFYRVKPLKRKGEKRDLLKELLEKIPKTGSYQYEEWRAKLDEEWRAKYDF